MDSVREGKQLPWSYVLTRNIVGPHPELQRAKLRGRTYDKIKYHTGILSASARDYHRPKFITADVELDLSRRIASLRRLKTRPKTLV